MTIYHENNELLGCVVRERKVEELQKAWVKGQKSGLVLGHIGRDREVCPMPSNLSSDR